MKKQKEYLAYYQVFLKGATLYLHQIVLGRDIRAAGKKFFSQPDRHFGGIEVRTKGIIGLAGSRTARKLLREVGGGLGLP